MAENTDNKSFNEKKKLVKLGAVMALVLIVIVAATIAWFYQSDEVTGEGMSVRADGELFELRTEGYMGVYDDPLLSSEYARLEEHELGSLETSGSSTCIQWLVTAANQQGNYSGNPDEDMGIKPGSYGSLRFWVVPKNGQDSIKLKFSLNMTPYRYNYMYDSNRQIVMENGEPKEEAATPMTAGYQCIVGSTNYSYQDIMNVLSGHILYFENYGDVETEPASDERPAVVEHNKYSRLIDNSFERTITFTNGEPQEIEVFWVWPETLEEAVLTTNDPKCICAGNDTQVIEAFKTKPERFLLGGAVVPEGQEIDRAYIEGELKPMSHQYNNADQLIGDNVSCFMLELTAEPVA